MEVGEANPYRRWLEDRNNNEGLFGAEIRLVGEVNI